MQCAECPILLGKFATNGTRGRVHSQKLLARRAPLSQARAAMNSLARFHTCGRALVAAFISAAFLWSLALSVSPPLPPRIHADPTTAAHSSSDPLIPPG